MQFPFETTTKDGRAATVLGTMPDARLVGFIEFREGPSPWDWDADGSCLYGQSITLPLRIKPLTTYRMRGGGIAWTSGRVEDGWIYGIDADGVHQWWRISDGRWDSDGGFPLDLIEELPPGTTE